MKTTDADLSPLDLLLAGGPVLTDEDRARYDAERAATIVAHRAVIDANDAIEADHKARFAPIYPRRNWQSCGRAR